MKAEKLLGIIDSVQDLVAFFNDPTNDQKMLQQAGIPYSDNLLPIIVLLGSHKVATVGELARALGRDHSSMSRKVASLQKQGLLTATVSPTDLRSRQLSLTKKGAELFTTITETRHQVMSQALAALSEDEVDQISASLKKLAEIVKRQ